MGLGIENTVSPTASCFVLYEFEKLRMALVPMEKTKG